MKVRLLKRLRKHFVWTIERNDKWTIYNKWRNREDYAYIPGLFRPNDMAIYFMLEELCEKSLFRSLDDRLRAKRKKKEAEALRIKYNN